MRSFHFFHSCTVLDRVDGMEMLQHWLMKLLRDLFASFLMKYLWQVMTMCMCMHVNPMLWYNYLDAIHEGDGHCVTAIGCFQKEQAIRITLKKLLSFL